MNELICLADRTGLHFLGKIRAKVAREAGKNLFPFSDTFSLGMPSNQY